MLPQQGVLILARHTILAGFWQDEVTTLDVTRLEHASDHGVGHAEHLQDVALTVVPRRIRGADGQVRGCTEDMVADVPAKRVLRQSCAKSITGVGDVDPSGTKTVGIGIAQKVRSCGADDREDKTV